MENEYENLLKNTTFGQLSTISLLHRLPCSWGAIVAVGGVKFFYTGGGDFIDSQVLNLTCGQDAYFRNNDPSKCVYQVQIYFTVVIPGHPAQTMGQTQVCPAGQCVLNGEFVLNPKATISEAELNGMKSYHMEVISRK